MLLLGNKFQQANPLANNFMDAPSTNAHIHPDEEWSQSKTNSTFGI